DYECDSTYEGVIPNLERRYHETDSDYTRKNIHRFMEEALCNICDGKRLRPEILAVTLLGKSIIEVTDFSIEEAGVFFGGMAPELTETENHIARLILQEINNRLSFLKDVGLNYLTLGRTANTL